MVKIVKSIFVMISIVGDIFLLIKIVLNFVRFIMIVIIENVKESRCLFWKKRVVRLMFRLSIRFD